MDEERRIWASQLIQMFAAALRDLNDGDRISDEMYREIKNTLGFGRRTGRPINIETRERDNEIAHRVLRHSLALERGETAQSKADFYERLSQELQRDGISVDPDHIPVIAGRHKNDARAAEISKRLDDKAKETDAKRKERADRIQARIQSGESLDSILCDPDIGFQDFKMIREHQTEGKGLEGRSTFRPAPTYSERHERIISWINDGHSRQIDCDPVPIAILNRSHQVEPIGSQRKKQKSK